MWTVRVLKMLLPLFDADQAREDGLSIDACGRRYVNAFAYDMSTGEAQDACLRGIPVWGNWYGPDHGGGTAKDHLTGVASSMMRVTPHAATSRVHAMKN